MRLEDFYQLKKKEGMAKHGGYIEFKKSLVGFSVLYVSRRL